MDSPKLSNELITIDSPASKDMLLRGILEDSQIISIASVEDDTFSLLLDADDYPLKPVLCARTDIWVHWAPLVWHSIHCIVLSCILRKMYLATPLLWPKSSCTSHIHSYFMYYKMLKHSAEQWPHAHFVFHESKSEFFSDL